MSSSFVTSYQKLWGPSREVPNVFDYLEQNRPAEEADILSVLVIDQRERWKRGIGLPVNEYLDGLPGVTRPRDFQLKLAIGEFQCLDQAGDAPKIDEFVQRHPDLGEELRFGLQVITGAPELLVDTRDLLDDLIDWFEESWTFQLEPPALELLVERCVPEIRELAIRELIEIEVWWRQKYGESCGKEDYASRFPEYIVDAAASKARSSELAPVRTLYEPEATASDGLEEEDSVVLEAHRPSWPKGIPPEIGPYKLLQEIGQGGMGTVYMAEQSKPVTRRVALKIIKPGMDSRQVIARFEAERQALAMMEHPNIARVLDAGTTPQGRPFFVMELVRGVPITRYCDEHRLTPQERLTLFLPVCEAIQHAHQKGIIHRDIKPTNVLVTQFDDRPVPKVIDFGLAKAVSQPLTDKTMFTQFGQILGTIDYMSPEQASFNQVDIDTRTDIYSLGVVLYELLTGETPFDRKRLHRAAFDELIRIIQNEEPPRPSIRLSSSASLPDTAIKRRTEPHKLSRLVRDELDWIVMKALEKDRSQRYETANGFSADIKRYLNDEQVVACPPSNWNRFKKFSRRNKMVIGTVGAVCLALTLGLVGTAVQAIRANKQRDRALVAEQLAESRLIRESKARVAAQQATNEAESARDEAQISRDEAKDALFDLNTSFGLLADELGKPSEALLWFAEAAAIAKPGSTQERESRVRLRTWSRIVSTPIHVFEHEEVGLRAMHFDSSGKFLATLTFDDVLRVRDLSKDADLVVSFDGVTSMDWHPNRPELAVGNSEGKVKLLAEPSFLSRGEMEIGEPVSSICYSPDGESLATGGRTVCIWNEIGDPAPERKFPHPGQVVSIQISKKSDRLLTVCEDDLARVFDLSDDSPVPAIPPIIHRGTGFPGRPLVEPRFVLEGAAVVTKSGNILIWSDTDSGGQSKRIAMDGPNVTCLSVSPDEQTLLIAGQDMGYEVWNCKLQKRVGGHRGERNASFWSTSFSPDGLEFLVANGDGSHQRINIQDGSLIGEPSPPQRGHHHHTEYSPTGRHLATCDGEGRLFVWLLRTLPPVPGSGSTWGDPQPTVQAWAEPRARHARLLGKATDLALSRSGKLLLTCGSNRIFGTLADAQLLSTPDLKADRPSFPANSLLLDAVLSPDESIVVTASLRHELVFWDARDGNRIGPPVQVAAEPIVVKFNDDGSRLMCLQVDGAVVVLDAKSRQIVTRMQHGDGRLPDFRRQGSLNMYRQANGYPMLIPDLGYAGVRFHYHFLQAIDNGRWVITGGVDDAICVWNGRNGSLRYPPIQLTYFPTAITISADEQLLATTDGVDVAVFELTSGDEIARLNHSQGLFRLRFNSDATRLASCTGAGLDGEVFLWNHRKHTLIASVDGKSAAFFGDADEWLLTVGRVARCWRCWSATSGRPVTPKYSLACDKARNLIVSNDQHRAFVSGYAHSSSITLYEGNGGYVDALPLDDLYDKSEFSVAEWRQIVEVLSGYHMQDNTVVELEISEWTKRYLICRDSFPEMFPRDWNPKDIAHWHETQRIRALRKSDWYAAAWHLDKLGELLGSRHHDVVFADLETNVLQGLDLAKSGRVDEAISLWETGVVPNIRTSANRSVLNVAYDFAVRLRSSKRLTDAAKVGRLTHQTQVSVLGEDDKDTLETLHFLADSNWHTGNREEASRQFEEVSDRLQTLVNSAEMDFEARYRLVSQLTTCSDEPQRDYRRAHTLAMDASALVPRSYSWPAESMLNMVAWPLCSSSDSGARDIKLALQAAQRALELKPNDADYLNTLGVALYRDGQWAAAIETLEKSADMHKGVNLALDGFFLAMANFQLGERQKADEWFTRSVDVMKESSPDDDELIQFRAEAEDLMQMDSDDDAANTTD
ncbi:Serine/threonine-protein kinase PknB [Stieleria neptunia]|uniref:Serine/threonine-protein kinase PknB n=1 Tax=Stieleria neptunia TaxID=2527979 RepID=A0A518HSS3_9BACT|nr:WD40 repeat domain-containing serine/threonine protein kinase [Stieleria neptunia]QDV43886.1 Serine/threonine-protein kinase PknB [Stieleria neptunia]